MNRSKKSMLNAIFALLQMAVTSIFSLVLSRNIMSHYGSDYNGINSIVTSDSQCDHGSGGGIYTCQQCGFIQTLHGKEH